MFTTETGGESVEGVLTSTESQEATLTPSIAKNLPETEENAWMGKWVPFKPRNYNLATDFKFRNYSALENPDGWKNSSVPSEVQKVFVENVSSDDLEDARFWIPQMSSTLYSEQDAISVFSRNNDVTIFSVTRHEPILQLIQVEDLTYPCIDDPYLGGRIACIQLLSNLHALGLYELDNLLMLLTVSDKLKTEEQDVVIPLLMEGFRDVAAEAKLKIGGGQTCRNPWVSIGGILTTASYPQHFLPPIHASEGDVLVLTKPLGIETVLRAYELRFSTLKEPLPGISDEDLINAYQMALYSMTRMDVHAAKLMRKYNAHGGTSIGRYGLLGHAQRLVTGQINPVDFVIYNLPIFANADKFSKLCPGSKVLKGLDQEISGGLLVILPAEKAFHFMKDLEQVQRTPSWIVGVVKKGSRTAKLSLYPRKISVNFPKISKH